MTGPKLPPDEATDSQPGGEGAPGTDRVRAPIDELGEIELDDTPESAAAVSATGGDDDGSKDATAAERTKNVDEPSEPLPLARELREADPEPDDDNLVNFDPVARRRVGVSESRSPIKAKAGPSATR